MTFGPLKTRAALAALALASVAVGFHALLLERMPAIFRDPLEDMSFGWFIPVFSLYVLWSERDKVLASLGAPGWGGLVAMLPFVALGFLGARGLQVRFEVVSFVGLLLCVAWAFFGRRTVKAVLFPVCFLLFCIPLATFLDVITVHLRLFASSVAYLALETFGADVFRHGTIIGALDGSFSIDVAEPCSGLRSIFALMALTAGYAYFNQPTWPRRLLLFASSVPLAIIGNVMRILTICIVAQYASAEFATGFYHDYSGYVVFVVAILLMLAFGEAINRWCERRGAGKGEPEAEDVKCAAPVRGSLAVPIAALVLLVPAMAYQAASPAVTLAEAPDVHFGDIDGYARRTLTGAEAETRSLPPDTRVEKSVYTSPGGRVFAANMVVGGASKSSIHRPELCLPAQGWQMVSPRTVEVGGRDWRFITLEGRGGRSGIAYTFFNQEGFRTASHTARIMRDIIDRSVLNRIDRWVMIEVMAPGGDDASLKAAVEAVSGGMQW